MHLAPVPGARGPRSRQYIFEGFSLGMLVRFIALGVLLRHLVPTLRRRDEWSIVAGAATLTAAVFVAALLL